MKYEENVHNGLHCISQFPWKLRVKAEAYTLMNKMHNYTTMGRIEIEMYEGMDESGICREEKCSNGHGNNVRKKQEYTPIK